MASTKAEYEARRLRMINYLGAKCAKCEVVEGLQFDHIDPATKSFDVSKSWSRSWSFLVEELDKCQLLCRTHHLEKSRRNKELGGGQNKWTELKHGTVYAYSTHGCRCTACKRAKSDYYYVTKPD